MGRSPTKLGATFLLLSCLAITSSLAVMVSACTPLSPLRTVEPDSKRSTRTEPRVVHVVLIWLKEPGNAAHQRALIKATRNFKQIPGVLRAKAGPPLLSDREIVDDSFDLGITLLLESEQALREYLAHPLHQDAARQVMRPLAKKVLVYDFVSK